MYGYILTNILAYGGAVVALFHPFVGVCIYWGLEVVRPQYMFSFAGPQGRYAEAVAIGTLIGWAVNGFGNLKLGRARPVLWFLVAYMVWATLAAAASPEPDLSFGYFREHGKVWLMFVVAISLIDTVERAKIAAWVVAGSIGYVTAEFNQFYYLRGDNYLQKYGYAGMDNNSFALAIVTLLPTCAYLGLYTKKLWQKALAFGGAALALHAVLLSYSRGSFLGLVVAGAVALVVTRKKPGFVVAALLGALVALRLAGSGVRVEFASAFASEEERDGSAQSRIDLWKDCLEVMGRYPLLGIGQGRFRRIAHEFGWPPGKDAHTLWLTVGAEMGVPALVFLLGFYGTTALMLFPLARSRIDDEPWRWLSVSAAMVLVCLAGFAVSGLFVSMQGLEGPYIIVAMGVAAIRVAEQERLKATVASPVRTTATAITAPSRVATPAVYSGSRRPLGYRGAGGPSRGA